MQLASKANVECESRGHFDNRGQTPDSQAQLQL